MRLPQQGLKTQQTATLTTAAYAAGTNGTNMVSGTAICTLTATNLRAFDRFSDESDDVLFVASGSSVEGIYLGDKNIIPEISALTAAGVSTKLSVSGTQIEAAVVNAKKRVKDIKALGDYFLDAQAGLLIVHSDYALGSVSGDTVKFYIYAGAASQAHQHVYFVGNCQAGDYITYDKFSNFTATSTVAGALGRVLEVQSFPKSLMERVTTAWQGSSFDASMRMPGSATEGLPDNLTLAGQNDEVVGNRMVIANIRIL